MRRARTVALAVPLLGLGLLIASGASAQPGAPPPIPDETVRRMLVLGLQNIQRAVCDGFNTCAPATPAELEHPPITVQQARVALMIGTRTALARWCDLDTDRRSVQPMTRELRKLRLNNRQMALVAVIHGIQDSIVSEQLKARGACDAATRSKLDAELPPAARS